MNTNDILVIDEDGPMFKFAIVNAPSWRIETDTPTICPFEIYYGKSGWWAYYPAGLDFVDESLTSTLRKTGIKPEWLKRI